MFGYSCKLYWLVFGWKCYNYALKSNIFYCCSSVLIHLFSRNFVVVFAVVINKVFFVRYRKPACNKSIV
jgi:hypothetical protein